MERLEKYNAEEIGYNENTDEIYHFIRLKPEDIETFINDFDGDLEIPSADLRALALVGDIDLIFHEWYDRGGSVIYFDEFVEEQLYEARSKVMWIDSIKSKYGIKDAEEPIIHSTDDAVSIGDTAG